MVGANEVLSRIADKLLASAGWVVQDKRSTNLSVGRGVAVREFPLKPGHGEADYLLFVDGSPVGVVEAKKEGDTLTGVELQTTKYGEGVPDNLTTPRRPLPFQYQSTGAFTAPPLDTLSIPSDFFEQSGIDLMRAASRADTHRRKNSVISNGVATEKPTCRY